MANSSSSLDASSPAVDIPLPSSQPPVVAPNTINDVKSIGSWQELYKERRNWAMRLASDCSDVEATNKARFGEMDVMIKCLDAAVANLELSVKSVEPKYNELKKWAAPALLEYEQLSTGWVQHLELARNTPVLPSLAHFMTRGEIGTSNPTLEDLTDLDTTRKAGKLATTAHRRFSDKAAGLDNAAHEMFEGLEHLIADFDQLMNRSVLKRSTEASQLLDDIEAVVKQIDADYRTVLSLTSSQRDLAQASKTASNHSERLVPSLRKRAKEMYSMVRYATEARNTICSDSVKFMQAITSITSLHGGVKAQIQILSQSEDDMTTFDYLRLIHQLPYMYASFLAEAIRRGDWLDKIKSDSSTLANEMALFQDEESKRRRRWQKMVGSTYGPSLDTNAVGFEVNLPDIDHPWPKVNRDELGKFLDVLKSQDTDQIILEDVAQLTQELASPTKQQMKRLKAFKNGSVHEAALRRSGLLIRGDDDVLRALQDDKSRLENKLKTADSRVRRLEDLLHRQSQAARPNNLFQTQTTPTGERHSSVSLVQSSRPDGNGRASDALEQALRRQTELEGELLDQRRKSVDYEKNLKENANHRDDLKNEIQEINSTKKDLMENMEALKREFDEERKSFEDEIKALKARLEDTEDEIEHFGASRENEKANYDERVHALVLEAELTRKTHEDKDLEARGQVDFLRNENRLQREQLDVAKRTVETIQVEQQEISQQLAQSKDARDVCYEALKKAHDEMAPDSTVPARDADLADALTMLVTDICTKLQNSETDLSVARTEVDRTQLVLEELREEVIQITKQLSSTEDTSTRFKEELSGEKAKLRVLEDELIAARVEAIDLRAHLSTGESDAESVQSKLQEQEQKVIGLKETLAARQSLVGSLNEELRSCRDQLTSLEDATSSITGRYEQRDERTKDLTHRLFGQNDRLVRLLDRMGYAVTRVNDVMSINKIPRTERSSQNPNDSSDPGSSVRRSFSLGGRVMQDSTDLELLAWMRNSNQSAEAEQFDNFMKKLGQFDIDLFAETIYHRAKETEHKARKWQREARNYRDRAHAAQKDSHDKIAFRHFKEGDLALFLPTRNQQAGAWAAFNVGFPHFFLREHDAHRLQHREWLVARITRIQERTVNLSKSSQGNVEANSSKLIEDDNPFQLSDGLRWYLIDAHEDKPGAPSTPGMGKSTVAANTVEATASIHALAGQRKGKNRDSITSIEGINKTLSKSLESRRSSSGSKKAIPFSIAGGTAFLKSSALASETNSLRAAAPETPPIGTSPIQAELVQPGNVESLRQHIDDNTRGPTNSITNNGSDKNSSEVRDTDFRPAS